MVDGRTRLREWIDRSKMTDRAAAQLLGIHFTFLSQILNSGRDRSPSLKTAVRIERVTGIPVEAWMPTEVDDEFDMVVTLPSKRKIDKR